MVSANSFFTIYKGEYKEVVVSVQLDLTNARLIKWCLSAEDDDTTALLTKSYPASGIIHSGSGGTFTIVLSGVDTTSLTPGLYVQRAYYDLNGKTVESVVGTVRIRPTII